MLFCNYRPATRVVPVLFKSDIVYSLLSAAQGLSSGYLLSLSVMYAPKMVRKSDSPQVGMMIGISGQ
jgi:equilibrative nucleoside transporter 1/2/3